MSDDLDRDAPHVVRLANEIARHVGHEADPPASFLTHVEQFWEPRMRAQLEAEAPDWTQVLHPVVRQALGL